MIKSNNVEQDINVRDKQQYFHNMQVNKTQKDMINELRTKGYNVSTFLKLYIEELHNEHC